MNREQNHEQTIGICSEEQTKAENSVAGGQPTYIDVVAAMPGSEDKELIKNVRASRDVHGHILVSSVCQKLQEQGFNVGGTIVSYYSPVEEMYIFVGKDPIPPEKDGISIENLAKNRLHLKFRPGQDSSPKAAGGMMSSQMSVDQSQSKGLGGNFPDSNMSVDPTQTKGFRGNFMGSHMSLDPNQHNKRSSYMSSQMAVDPSQSKDLRNNIMSSQMSVDPSQDPNALNFVGGMNTSMGNNYNNAPPPAPIPNSGNPGPHGSSMGGGMDGDSNDKESLQDHGNLEIWSSAKANRRTKERKISFVIEKVSMWRKLYNGIQDNQGKIVRYSLEDAAKKVGISKKSLDDYLLQLRYGKKYGFDFNEHKEAKIGVLRAFVKKKKQEEKEKQKRKSGDSD